MRVGPSASGERCARRCTIIGWTSPTACATGRGAPIGDRWGDTKLLVDAEGVGSWRCLLSGVEVPVWDGTMAVAAALAELPFALLAPTKAV